MAPRRRPQFEFNEAGPPGQEKSFGGRGPSAAASSTATPPAPDPCSALTAARLAACPQTRATVFRAFHRGGCVSAVRAVRGGCLYKENRRFPGGGADPFWGSPVYVDRDHAP